MKSIVKTEQAPEAIGPYSQAVIAPSGKLVFTAGQIPMDPITKMLIQDGIEAQAEQVLKNLQAVLKAAGSGLGHVIKTTVFLKDMNDFARMNRVYDRFFPENPPARSAVEVSRLPKDVLVEMECVALIP
jgi:2-iminobutanoate/2-iminopropanoate deaminase